MGVMARESVIELNDRLMLFAAQAEFVTFVNCTIAGIVFGVGITLGLGMIRKRGQKRSQGEEDRAEEGSSQG